VSVELRLRSARSGYREQSEIRICPARKRDCLSVWRPSRVAVVPVASELDLIVGADLLGKDPGILVCSPARKRNALAIGRKRRFPGIFVGPGKREHSHWRGRWIGQRFARCPITGGFRKEKQRENGGGGDSGEPQVSSLR